MFATLALQVLGAGLLSKCVPAQFVPAPTDLTTVTGYLNQTIRYKEVPCGICETIPGVKSYSGYVDVAEDQHIFFYFIEARNQDPSDAPLTIWLNGGPGDTSMVGLFSENGPCYIDGNYNVQFNPYSWNNVSNMIYIDQPTQVGFSYSIPVPGYTNADGYIVVLPDETCPDYAQGSCGTYSYANFSLTADSTPSAAPNVWRTLQGFMGAFPQYARNGIHFSTESYGGHYGPVFAEYWETQNAANIPNSMEIDLLSLSIGNGWYDPRIQYPAYYNYSVNNTYGFQYLNDSTLEQMYQGFYGPGNCLDQLIDCNERQLGSVCSQTDDFCYSFEDLFDQVTGRDEYDIAELSPDPFPYQHFVTYLNFPEVQKAIGAYQNFSYSVTNAGTGTVASAFATTGDDSRVYNIIEDCQRLLEQGVYLLQYVGDRDYNCNWLGGQAVAEEIDAPNWSSAGYQNLSTSDCVIHGAVKQAGNFSFVRIYDSGHSVPFYQPLAALQMFERLLKSVDIATGNQVVTESYLSTGPAESTYQNDNSTIQTDVTDPCATYNVITNVPNTPVANCSADAGGSSSMRRRRRRRRRRG